MRWIALLVLLLLCGALMAGQPPAVMLAGTYRQQGQVADYLVSEKLDGVRARWDGRALWTRGGMRIQTPEGFTRGWPAQPLDGELWLGRGHFDAASALVRAGDVRDPRWGQLRFMLFDLPHDAGRFAQRVQRLQALVRDSGSATLELVPQRGFDSQQALRTELARVVAAGGEGLMLHRRDGLYVAGRSDALLKYKPYEDAEARVLAHLPGKGRLQGRMGALLVELADGRQLRLGTGFSDAQRAAPPPPGSWVTYRYNGLTATGLPRFARFLRVRAELPPVP